jgi:dihydroxyacetone kinase DhaKLM complex PTS-EIIA-like component DhaM
MIGWIVCVIGLILIVTGAVMMGGAASNIPTSPAGIQPAIQQNASTATTAIVLVSIGSLMVTGGLVAEIVASTLRPSSVIGARRHK